MAGPPKVVLTIAGSDSSAGAGIQADLKTFTALQTHGLTVVTSVVAETPLEVKTVHPLPEELVVDQCELLQEAFPIRAAKTGLLGSATVIEALLPSLRKLPGPIVVDPVAVASTGDSLVGASYARALHSFIGQVASLVTPNRLEAASFLGRDIRSSEEGRDAALELSQRFGCAVLLKGGHFQGQESTDWLADDSGIHSISRGRVELGDVHGTGCTLSAAIVAQLARQEELDRPDFLLASESARDYLHHSLQKGWQWETQRGETVKALAHLPPPMQSS
ncbi:MAG: bifunctional hydroxymethylpyrimidine kinase/phosphomethylpyrimidine kinase [Verrucomicrobiota bacterium]